MKVINIFDTKFIYLSEKNEKPSNFTMLFAIRNSDIMAYNHIVKMPTYSHSRYLQQKYIMAYVPTVCTY